MIDIDTFYKIKQLYHDGHLRVSRIAEQLHLDAETVAKWIQRDTYSQRTVPRRSSKLDAYKTSIIDLVENQALSSAKILKTVQMQGYTGGMSILTDFVREADPPLPISRRELFACSWIHKAMQNAISCEAMYVDLKREFEPELVALLLREIKSGPLRNRNKAVALLARKKGFSLEIVSRFLFVNIDTVVKWLQTFKEGGAGELFAPRSRGVKKADQKEYKDAVFSILHAPPSSYGINRTSWRIEDITRILRQTGLRICKDVVSKIIKRCGISVSESQEGFDKLRSKLSSEGRSHPSNSANSGRHRDVFLYRRTWTSCGQEAWRQVVRQKGRSPCRAPTSDSEGFYLSGRSFVCDNQPNDLVLCPVERHCRNDRSN